MVESTFPDEVLFWKDASDSKLSLNKKRTRAGDYETMDHTVPMIEISIIDQTD